MTRFVIVGIQRTGTTLIRTSLDSHPEIRCVGEAFLFTYGVPFLKRARGSGVDLSYRRYVGESCKNLAADILFRRQSVFAYLDRLYRMPDFQAIGFKFMLAQHKQFPMAMDYMREHDFRIIHVIRKNALKTHVSRFRTKVTGVAHSEHKVVPQKLNLKTKGLLEALRKIAATNQEWEALCSGLPYLMVTYESFVSNRDEESKRLLDFLDISNRKELVSPYRKVTSNDLKGVLENYGEVENCLRNTEFESCLYE